MFGIKYLSEYQRLAVFRQGTPTASLKGPSWVFYIPIIDSVELIDLREQVREFNNNFTITKDKLPAFFTLRIYYKILDPVKMIATVRKIDVALLGIIVTHLRARIATIMSSDLPSELKNLELIQVDERFREYMNKLGVNVTHLNILNLAVHDYQKK